jgi:ABC-type Na+ efflux pump permease subunit
MKFIAIILLISLLACSTSKEIVTVQADSTKTEQSITDEDKIGYIAAVAIAGFIVLSIIIISNIVPPETLR